MKWIRKSCHPAGVVSSQLRTMDGELAGGMARNTESGSCMRCHGVSIQRSNKAVAQCSKFDRIFRPWPDFALGPQR
ncbi:MAG: hypothetical protein Kow0026_21140 [Oricola sp.]